MNSNNNYINTTIFSQECNFILGATKKSNFPNNGIGHFAFIGRSNVGKSSLINKIVSRKKIARVSNTPGRTREINFFNLANKLILTDLPGYGYAKISKNIKNNWLNLVEEYFSLSGQIKRTYILIDSRRSFMPIDLEFMHFLDEVAVTYKIIFTKTDLVSQKNISKLEQDFNNLLSVHTGLNHNFLKCSSKKNTNIIDIQQDIISLL